jgi:hypothetical protein
MLYINFEGYKYRARYVSAGRTRIWHLALRHREARVNMKNTLRIANCSSALTYTQYHAINNFNNDSSGEYFSCIPSDTTRDMRHYGPCGNRVVPPYCFISHSPSPKLQV